MLNLVVVVVVVVVFSSVLKCEAETATSALLKGKFLPQSHKQLMQWLRRSSLWVVSGAEKLTLVLRLVATLSPLLRLSVLSPIPFPYELVS